MNSTFIKRLKPELRQPVIDAFESIPAAELLAAAVAARSALAADPSLVRSKGQLGLVTVADTALQKILLAHFANSRVAGTYRVKAEEELSEEALAANSGDKLWQLVIDPLDGTDAFCAGRDEWGIMCGCCDRTGHLLYSWNMLSQGQVYSSGNAALGSKPVNWSEKLLQGNTLHLDVFDYGAGARERFGEFFLAAGSGQALSGKFQLAELPSAVWAGWELFSGNLDGLLWLASDKGKRFFPDYDLVFTAALAEQGWRISLGYLEQEVAILAIAPGEEELEHLWKTGLAILPEETSSRIEIDNELKITSEL